ncbi:MAG: prolipoprotein diacylglyceryl transferase [candidate division Zixibacteria bacterium HGW-Zixibacteria-1]|nr:MAG: prolipoprotein diacylglyceryl transferase [candidate division Zixibacteria bacterium HGW-Zixibacteria-1]
MYPELFKIGAFAIRSYGVMLAISFLLGVYYVSRMASREKKDFGVYLTLAYIMVFAGIIGARLSYVLFHLDEFSGSWTNSFNPFHSDRIGIAGLNMYGGVILAVLGSYIYLRIKKMSVLDTFDIFAPTIGLGLAITRIGCYLNGCCFGTPTELPWGVVFQEHSIPWYIFGTQHLHPAQLYSSLYGLLLFIFLHWRLKNRQFVGQVIALMFMIEAVFRYGIEYVRYYESEMHVNILGMQPTYNHLISIGLFLLGLGIYIFRPKK